MLLTGLPIFSFVELAGGVEPDLVLAGFAVTAVTMISLASLSALASVYARRSWQAILYAYLLVAVYLVLSVAGKALYTTVVPTLFFWTMGDSQITAADFLDWFLAGNPILQLIELTRELAFGGSGQFADSLARRLRDYMLFHGVVTVFCAAWAVARLRAVFLKQADNQPQGGWRRNHGRRWLRVGAWPMFWKEVVVEGGLRFGWAGRLLLAVLVIASF